MAARATPATWTATDRTPGHYAGGDTLAVREMDQRSSGGTWRELDAFDLPAGWNRGVLSRRGPSGDVVVADTVRVR